MVCNHPDVDKITREKMKGETNVVLAETYFKGKTPKTVQNALCTHWKKHVNPNLAVSIFSTLESATQGAPLALSTQRIFDNMARKRADAQQDIEKIIGVIKERINVLEDEFASMHLVGKCDACGRGDRQDTNYARFTSVIAQFTKLYETWLKIKNPKAVIKLMFDTTFLRFVENIMAHYVSTLQEKGRLIRQAVNEFSEGKISHQLLLRRVAEVEDMGSTIIAEKGIMEMRAIQEHINREFGKSSWGT
jgi:hypothetical protein